jgi:hypothetical protein
MIMHVSSFNGSACTIPTMIEVASSLAIAHITEYANVIFYSDCSSRNLLVYGLQDLIGLSTLFLLVRIYVDTGQKVQDLLRDSQNFQKAMMPHEHHGWVEVRQMNHLKHSLNVNINPTGLSSIGGKLGLDVQSCHETFDDPFGINVSLCDSKIEWKLYYDERFVARDKVDKFLNDIERSFLDSLKGIYSQS